MANTYVSEQIKRCSRNLFIVNACIFLLISSFAYHSKRYLRNFLFGPFEVDAARLDAIANVSLEDDYIVKVRGEEVFETGVQQVRQTIDKTTKKVISEEPTSEYLALLVGSRLLIVKVLLGQKGLEYTGTLNPVKPNMQTEILGQIKDPEIVQAFLPFFLDLEDFRSIGYWGIGVLGPILLLAGWNLLKGFNRHAHPDEHPLWQKLQRYGAPQQVDEAVSKDVSASTSKKVSSLTMGLAWMVNKSFFAVDVLNTLDLIWAYKKQTTHYMNFVKTGVSHETILHGRSGEVIEISCKEEQADEILGELSWRSPWVVIGYS